VKTAVPCVSRHRALGRQCRVAHMFIARPFQPQIGRPIVRLGWLPLSGLTTDAAGLQCAAQCGSCAARREILLTRDERDQSGLGVSLPLVSRRSAARRLKNPTRSFGRQSCFPTGGGNILEPAGSGYMNATHHGCCPCLAVQVEAQSDRAAGFRIAMSSANPTARQRQLGLAIFSCVFSLSSDVRSIRWIYGYWRSGLFCQRRKPDPRHPDTESWNHSRHAT
jgi:hypothetical protein